MILGLDQSVDIGLIEIIVTAILVHPASILIVDCQHDFLPAELTVLHAFLEKGALPLALHVDSTDVVRNKAVPIQNIGCFRLFILVLH